MYNRKVQGWFKHLDFILLDCVCLYLSLLLAYMIRMGSWNLFASEIYNSISLVLLLADIAVAFLFNTFKNVLRRGYYKEFTVTIKHACLVEAVVIVYLFTIQESMTYSRIIIYLMVMFYVLISYATRVLWKRHLQKVIRTSRRKSLLIVTLDNMAEDIIRNISTHNYEHYDIKGLVIINKEMKGQEIAGVPVLADINDAADCACRKWIDEVLISIPHGTEYPEGLEAQFMEMGIAVHVALFRMNSESKRKRFIERMGNYTVVTTAITEVTPLQQMMKRGMDIAGGIVGCIITGILFLFLAPIIYIKSPGPVFFKQERVGINGRHFKMYKFRSMYLDAEKRKADLMAQNRIKDNMMFKLEADPRIIGCKINADGTVKKGIGNFIRDYSLDEFPQFFNVLKGDMSLVGTRPPTVDEWERYERHHRARLAVKPGITGLWQISGRSDILDFEEVVRLDTEYIADWNIGLDWKILFKTVGVVLRKNGAM